MTDDDSETPNSTIPDDLTLGQMKAVAFRMAQEMFGGPFPPGIRSRLEPRVADASEIVRMMTCLEIAERLWAVGTTHKDDGIRRGGCLIMELALKEVRDEKSEFFRDFLSSVGGKHDGLDSYEQTLAERKKEIGLES